MKCRSVLPIVISLALLSFPNVNLAQSPGLGAAANFVLFSSVGAVGNTGISQLTGDIGTNSGAITGFGNVNGVMRNTDAVTAQAVTDLQTAWYYLDTLTPTAVHGPVFGGDTLYAGVYAVAAAGSIAGVLTLNALGDSSAVFVIKTGGAFTTAASATVNLINGALACNVFWVAEGAISMAASTVMRGTLIAHNGAVDMGAGGTIEGRALSTTGAVSVYGTLAYIPLGCGSTILTGPVAPTLNTLACFALFSSNGAVANSGVTHITGDIGTNNGSTTGYNPLLVAGSVRPVPDVTTAQCAADLQNVYTYLAAMPHDIELLYPAQLGNKLVLTPHTYYMNSAATLTDTLYLDAEGNTSAVFVIWINGALSTATYSKVGLINGAQAKNVYWMVDGAVTINDYSVFCGTLVCHNAIINLATGVALTGRALATMGALNTVAITAASPLGGYCSVLPVGLLSFTAACDKQDVVLNWSTAMETNNDYFTVERSTEGLNWQVAGTVKGAGSSFLLQAYSFTDKLPGKTISWYRLKQTDFGGNYKYGPVVSVKGCAVDAAEQLTLYPNPSAGKFDLLFTGDPALVYSIEVFSAGGEKIYESTGFQSAFDLSGKARGVYFVRVQLHSNIINREIIIK